MFLGVQSLCTVAANVVGFISMSLETSITVENKFLLLNVGVAEIADDFRDRDHQVFLYFAAYVGEAHATHHA